MGLPFKTAPLAGEGPTQNICGKAFKEHFQNGASRLVLGESS